jgi:hypothetical protein
MEKLMAAEVKKLRVERPERHIPHNKRFLGADGLMYKRCPRCGLTKDSTGFYNTKHNGWAGNCRQCQSEEKKARREAEKARME